MHADDLGQGGLAIKVTDGYLVAETDDFATAVLVEGSSYLLGRTVRVLVPNGAEGTLMDPSGKELELEGPVDVRLK